MVLKESFRMQNHLEELYTQAMAFLALEENIVSVREMHLRSKSNPKASDETVDIIKPSTMEPNKMIDLCLDILAEREKLSLAISKAKAAAEIDIDTAMLSNKGKMWTIRDLQELAKKKSSESMTRGTDYLINAEGNQTPYFYTLKTIRTIDFDRNMVKGIIKRLQKEADEVSAKIDLINVTLEVDYTSKYDFDDTLEDAYDKFTGK